MPLLIAALCVLPPRVTLQVRAQPLEKLVETLSLRTGRPLGVQAALAKEWMVVDAVDVDPQELLDRIAEVTHAKWEEDGKTLHLRVRVDYKTMLVRRKSSPPTDAELADVVNFAEMVDRAWRPIPTKYGDEPVLYDQARPCRRREIEFRIIFPSGHESVSTLQDFAFFPGVAFTNPAGLARWVKDLVRPPK